MSTTSEYWKRRNELSARLGDKTVKEIRTQSRKVYKETLKAINEEVEDFYNRYATENGLTIVEVKKLLNPKELSTFKKETERYYKFLDTLKEGEHIPPARLKKYRKELDYLSARSRISRLESLKAKLRYECFKLGFKEHKGIAGKIIKGIGDIIAKSKILTKQLKLDYIVPQTSESELKLLLNEKWAGDNYSNRVWKDKEKLVSELETTFTNGIARGQDFYKISQQLSKNLDVSLFSAHRLVRTEVIRLMTQVTLNEYKTYGTEKYQYLATLSERTCEVCGALDLKVFNVKDARVGENYPPIHPNCVLPENIVYAPNANAMTRSYYLGDVIKIFTSKGSWLSVTPNHILLTSRGWVRAKNIIKGDKIIHYVAWDEFLSNPTYNHSEPTVENIFTSLVELPFVLTKRVKATAEDFKGDSVKDTKIDIISTNSLLRNKTNVPFKKFISDSLLINTSKSSKCMFPRNCSVGEFLYGVSLAFDRLMSVEDISSVFFGSSVTTSNLHRFGYAPNYDIRLCESSSNYFPSNTKPFSKFLNAMLGFIKSNYLIRIIKNDFTSTSDMNTIINKNPSDRLSATMKNARKLCDRFSTIIEFDDVTDVVISKYKGQVYDFSSESTLYICNGYLSSNCRCTTMPYVEQYKDLIVSEKGRTSEDPETKKSIFVRSDMTYTEWRKLFNKDK